MQLNPLPHYTSKPFLLCTNHILTILNCNFYVVKFVLVLAYHVTNKRHSTLLLVAYINIVSKIQTKLVAFGYCIN